MTIQVLLFNKSGEIRFRAEQYLIEASSVVITDSRAIVICAEEGCERYEFQNGDLQDLYLSVIDLLEGSGRSIYRLPSVRQVQVDMSLINVASLLAKTSPASMLHFIYTYCLGFDKTYFAGLLKQHVACDQDFYDFIEANFCEPWSVTQFANQLGLSVRKLNFLFHEKFGMSTKHWLLERRLRYARKLLLQTERRVIDIALECGFSNHAHFTESFRKRYRCSPTGIRQGQARQAVKNNADLDLTTVAMV